MGHDWSLHWWLKQLSLLSSLPGVELPVPKFPVTASQVLASMLPPSVTCVEHARSDVTRAPELHCYTAISRRRRNDSQHDLV